MSKEQELAALKRSIPDGSYPSAETCRSYLDACTEIHERWAEKEREVLRWAVPLAELAMEIYRYDRIKYGHNSDIIGTYKNGETWVGIWQKEVDAIEKAREILRNLP